MSNVHVWCIISYLNRALNHGGTLSLFYPGVTKEQTIQRLLFDMHNAWRIEPIVKLVLKISHCFKGRQLLNVENLWLMIGSWWFSIKILRDCEHHKGNMNLKYLIPLWWPFRIAIKFLCVKNNNWFCTWHLCCMHTDLWWRIAEITDYIT